MYSKKRARWRVHHLPFIKASTGAAGKVPRNSLCARLVTVLALLYVTLIRRDVALTIYLGITINRTVVQHYRATQRHEQCIRRSELAA
jgi:hypothetical protein